MFARVLAPIDFSEGSRRVLAVALHLQACFGSEVHLFNLTEPSETDRFLAGVGADPVAHPTSLVGVAEARLRRFTENVLLVDPSTVHVHAAVGVDTVKAIAEVVEETDATLVLLADTSRHSLMRTQVEKVVRELHASVVLVRVPDETLSQPAQRPLHPADVVTSVERIVEAVAQESTRVHVTYEKSHR